jgi:hypothetical protein
MSITLPASITGAAQTGFTSPVYTTSPDTAVDTNAKQVAVTALGGTQAGVDTHSVSRPFTVAAFRPKQYAVLGKPNPVTGILADVPMNTYKVIGRKGVTPLAGQASRVSTCTIELKVPAGADIADPANIRALVSATIGTLNNISAGLGDTLINGVL